MDTRPTHAANTAPLKITTLQITLDVVHGDEIDPTDVARHAAHLADSQVTKRGEDDGVGMVSSTILGTRDYEGKGARSYDACDCADCNASASVDVDEDDERRLRAMKITALQITFDVTHRDESDPTDVALAVADTVHDAVTWTEWPGLATAIDRAHRLGGDGVGIVSSTALETRACEGKGARAYDDKDAGEGCTENVADQEADSFS